MEAVAAVRRVWPATLPLTVCLGVVEFDGRDDETLADSIQVLKWLKAEGVDLVDAGIGFSTPGQVPSSQNILVPMAARIRAETGLQVATSWLITDAREADSFVRDRRVDLVMLARPLLANPHWPYAAARELAIDKPASVLPTQAAFPDLVWTVNHMVAEGDTVAIRYTMTGTHRGNFAGVPGTNKPVTAESMAFYRLAGGKIVEERAQLDMLSVLQQIGTVPGAK